MGYIKKYSYIRALIIGIPFGILSIISGINLFGNLTKIEQLKIVEGKIMKIEIKDIERSKRKYNLIAITLINGETYYSGEYKETIKEYFAKKTYKNIPVKIYHETNKDYIKQIKINDKFLFKYKPPYWIAHFFLWVGVIITTTGLIYVIKHPEDLTGKKENKE